MTVRGHGVSTLTAARVGASAWLIGAAFLDQETSVVVTLATVILLGVPHGALDGEVARPKLRPHFGAGWFVAFAVPYLGLSALVLVAWRSAPMATLAAFLALSVWHFGTEDAGPRPLSAFFAGGLPIAAPVLLQPVATAHLLGMVALHPLDVPPVWLEAGALAWCAAAAWWAGRAVVHGRGSSLVEPACLVGAYAVLPPLTGLAIYFVCLHAPRHMAGLIDDRRLVRVAGWASAVGRSMPITVLTLAIGAVLWRWFPGPAADRLLALTIEGLAALTLPHMLLNDAHQPLARLVRRLATARARRVRRAPGGWPIAGR